MFFETKSIFDKLVALHVESRPPQVAIEAMVSFCGADAAALVGPRGVQTPQNAVRKVVALLICSVPAVGVGGRYDPFRSRPR